MIGPRDQVVDKNEPFGARTRRVSDSTVTAASLRVSNAKLKAASDWRPRVATAEEGWPLVAKD